MMKNQPGQFKHVDPISAVEHFLELIVSFNERLVFGILKVMATNVIPELACDLSPRKGFVAYDLCQLLVRLDGLHKSRAGLSFSLGFRCSSHNKILRLAKPKPSPSGCHRVFTQPLASK